MPLQSNTISHWLGTNRESALRYNSNFLNAHNGLLGALPIRCINKNGWYHGDQFIHHWEHTALWKTPTIAYDIWQAIHNKLLCTLDLNKNRFHAIFSLIAPVGQSTIGKIKKRYSVFHTLIFAQNMTYTDKNYLEITYGIYFMGYRGVFAANTMH